MDGTSGVAVVALSVVGVMLLTSDDGYRGRTSATQDLHSTVEENVERSLCIHGT